MITNRGRRGVRHRAWPYNRLAVNAPSPTSTEKPGAADEHSPRGVFLPQKLQPSLAELTAIIPAYNESEGIGDTVRRLRDAFPDLDIVVIDDGSRDNTADIARAVAGVRVVQHGRNRGYGAALKTGLRNTARPFVIWYDADGQHRPEDLLAVALPVLERRADATIGTRGRDSAVQRDRRLGKRILNFVAQAISGEKIPDLNSGLRCFRREVLARYLHLLPDGFSASTTTTLLMMKRGYRLEFIPIVVGERVGKSTVKVVRDGMRTLQLIVRIIVLFEAFRVFATLGLGLMVPALVYGTIMAIVRGAGFPMLAGTIVVSGLLTFFMGIIADQITELRKERFEDASELIAPRPPGDEAR